MYFADIANVFHIASELGLVNVMGEERLLHDSPEYRAIIYFGFESIEHLVFSSVMRNHLEFSQINEAAQLITAWNEKRIGPTALLEITDDAKVVLKFRASLPMEDEATREQMKAFLSTASETTHQAARHFIEAFPVLAQRVPRTERLRQNEIFNEVTLPGSTTEVPAMSTELTERCKRKIEKQEAEKKQKEQAKEVEKHRKTHPPVTLERVRDTLDDLEISHNELTEQRLIIICKGIVCSFFIDTGPTLLVRGHWMPSLDPDKDYMRLFLLCNEWNESAAATKAFCHTNEEGLQVHVEYTVTVAEGMSDVQLMYTAAASIESILNAIDWISANTTGDSAVDWFE